MSIKVRNSMNVHFIDSMGSDLRTINAARISFANVKEVIDEKDAKLIDYLAKNKHMSPFEHNTATFIIECPLFIRSQIHRHRTFAYNEVSRRYTSEDIEFYLPDTLRNQAEINRQASDGELVKDHADLFLQDMYNHSCISLKLYNEMLDGGVAREMARAVLPQSLMTKFYMTGNLRNWANFIELRIDSHAQKEAQQIAKMLSDKLVEIFPESFGSIMRHLKGR